jgi:hypothetical protein
MKDEVYPARNGFHRWMGPTDSCDKCYGGGYYITEKGEKYCACPCGKERKRIEGANYVEPRIGSNDTDVG